MEGRLCGPSSRLCKTLGSGFGIPGLWASVRVGLRAPREKGLRVRAPRERGLRVGLRVPREKGLPGSRLPGRWASGSGSGLPR